MERYKYRAVNENGRAVKGVMSAANELDLGKQLQNVKLELVDCAPLNASKGSLSGLLSFTARSSFTARDLIQYYIHLEQMQQTGVPLLNALGDIRDTADNDLLRDALSEMHRDVSEGNSLSEAMKKHPKLFSNLDISLVSAAEDTGDLARAYGQLVGYHKWRAALQVRVKKATRYPLILLGVIVVTISVMMGFVVPQVVGFIESTDQGIPFYTQLLMDISGFFVSYWWVVISAPLLFAGLIVLLKRLSDDFAYKVDWFILRLPVVGEVIRKINIARFAQTFGSLFSSGIDVLQSLDSATRTVDNKALAESLDKVREKVQSGSALSDAFKEEFSTMVVRMVKVGEESGNLTKVMEQVAEFYTSDVDEAVDGMISLIEPILIAVLGSVVLWIAIAVFGPVYESFEGLDF